MSLATRIRELRLRAGQSLQEVADGINVSKTHIWELEKGRSQNPSVELLARLADHFKVTITSLVGEDLETATDEQLMRMFRQVGELASSDREILDDMIQAMIRRRRKGSDPD